jgi:hypothetical protein
MVTLLTPSGIATEYDPAVVDEKSVTVLADAVPIVSAVLAANEVAVRPPNNSDPAASARILRPRINSMVDTTSRVAEFTAARQA